MLALPLKAVISQDVVSSGGGRVPHLFEQTRRRYRFVVVGYVVMPVQLPHSSQNRA
jgi:hypothetical protein